MNLTIKFKFSSQVLKYQTAKIVTPNQGLCPGPHWGHRHRPPIKAHTPHSPYLAPPNHIPGSALAATGLTWSALTWKSKSPSGLCRRRLEGQHQMNFVLPVFSCNRWLCIKRQTSWTQLDSWSRRVFNSVGGRQAYVCTVCIVSKLVCMQMMSSDQWAEFSYDEEEWSEDQSLWDTVLYKFIFRQTAAISNAL